MWFKDVRQRLMIPGHKANQRKHGEDSCPNGNTDRKTSNTTPTVLAIRLLLGNKLSNLMEDPPGKELHAQASSAYDIVILLR